MARLADDRVIRVGTLAVSTHTEPTPEFRKECTVRGKHTVRTRERDPATFEPVLRVSTTTAADTLHQLVNYRTYKKTEYVIPAEIDFNGLVNLVEVDDDEHSPLPWDAEETADEYVHAVQPYDEFPATMANFTAARGYLGYVADNKTRCRVRIPAFRYKQMMIEYSQMYHEAGASKQVAYELAAANIRRHVSQIVEWRRQDETLYVVVSLTVEIAGERYSMGLGGIDREEVDRNTDHAHEIVQEVAEDVAAQMECDGFIIINQQQPLPAVNKSTLRFRYMQEKCLRFYITD